MAMVIPGLAMLACGIAYYRFTQDAPDGNFSDLRARGVMHAVTGRCQDEVVIITMAETKLRIISIDPLSDRMRLAKVERCALCRLQFPSRNERRVDRSDTRGVDLENGVQNIAVALTFQVEVSVADSGYAPNP